MRGQIISAEAAQRRYEMIFDELLNAVCGSAELPSTLNDKTKKAVMKLEPEVLGTIVKDK